MWYLFCGSNDLPAVWAYQGLKAAGLEPIELVSGEVLGTAVQWNHHMSNGDGSESESESESEGVSIDITLSDGRRICSDNIRGVINRLLSVYPAHLNLAAAGDRDYAMQEFTAFFCSWLYSLPGPVLNRPTPQGLCGQWRHISEWVWLAGQAGLPTIPYRKSSRDPFDTMGPETRIVPPGTPVNTVIVVKGEVVGSPLPDEICEGCRRLYELSGTELLGIDFTAGSPGSWIFAGATPFPDLRLGGQPFLDKMAQILKTEEEAKK